MSKFSYSNQERLKPNKSSSRLTNVLIITFIVVIGMVMVLENIARADRFDDQIRALQQENSQTRESQAALEPQEANLQAAVTSLRQKIAVTEAQIRSSQAQHKAVEQKIASLEVEIKEQRSVLGKNIRQLYMDDDMTTLEKIVVSDDLSDYLDKEQYNFSVQDKIRAVLQHIETLKKEQEEQKKVVEKLLSDQQAMQAELTAQRNESRRLLGLNQAQQAAFEGEMGQNNAKIAELRRQQAIENTRSFGGNLTYSGTGGYPWANYQPFPNSSVDPWGMYKRQCVSYTAWKVAATGRHMPYWGGRGNAKNWDDNARAAGIPVDYSPRVGDVAVSNSGTYGHVMYVEQVHGDGTITVSQYNAAWDGRYSVGRRSISGLVFVHF